MSKLSTKYRNMFLSSSSGALVGTILGPVGAICGATIGLIIGSLLHHFTD